MSKIEHLKAWIAQDAFKAKMAEANSVQAAAEIPEHEK
jgi:hypothetical protein